MSSRSPVINSALLIVSAVFFLMSCGKTDGPETTPQSLTEISVSADGFATRGAEFSDTRLTSAASLYITASMYDPQGNIFIPSVFLTSGNATASSKLKFVSGTTWKIDDPSVFLPLGGYSLKALAYGADIDNGTLPSAFGTGTCWKPTLSTGNAISGVVFDGVDTYGNQVDLLYGASSPLTGSKPGSLSLSHAMAQLIFNVKFTSPGGSFITTNAGTPDPLFKIDDILFVNNEGFKQYLRNESVTKENILLKTSGTFTVDNTTTTLKSSWSSLEAQAGKCAVNMTVGATQQRSRSNLSSVASSPVLGGASSWNVNTLLQDKLYQLGNPLLVPEQPFCDFIVAFTYNGVRYNSPVSLPSGTWKSGWKYIYNLEITSAGGIIKLVAAGQAIGGEYSTGEVGTDWM